MYTVRFKVIEESCRPVKAEPGATGYDLIARLRTVIPAGKMGKVPCGIRVEGMSSTDIQVRGRSGLASKGILAHFGTVDASYRGEVCALLFNSTDQEFVVEAGMRCAQLVIAPLNLHMNFVETTDELSETVRGEGGFGSTGVSRDDLNTGTDA